MKTAGSYRQLYRDAVVGERYPFESHAYPRVEECGVRHGGVRGGGFGNVREE
ncbi:MULTISPECIES: hypothetical protein [Butyricimonas]|uniref:hypothetical protein n=1 Tax=Butyricimonas TaxID=574697 RepID=UPI001EE08822|nr:MULTISPECIES: hypothetical protein [Butyricimonas]MCG4521665.1 hypothetical protein [Butyricimonas sp. DFI.6.44]